MDKSFGESPKRLLETERLMITEFTADMAQAVHENSLDDDTRRFVPDEVFETAEEAGTVIGELISQYGRTDGPLVYPVITKTGSENIGYVQLVPTEDGHWEIGYHIAKKYTGNGYATEAVSAFLTEMAERLAVREVYGICLKENAASKRVLDKCGFVPVYEGTGAYQGNRREIYKSIWKQGAEAADQDNVQIRFARSGDKDFWFSLDRHISEEVFERKIRDQTAYVLTVGNEPAGLLRWSLFWDNTPFCNLLYVSAGHQRKGYGRMLMSRWEADMRARGYGLIMTSTQADEAAQHFYRALGYRDCGGFVLPLPGYEQPTEIILAKDLHG